MNKKAAVVFERAYRPNWQQHWKITVSWDLISYNLVETSRRFNAACCCHFDGTHLTEKQHVAMCKKKDISCLQQ